MPTERWRKKMFTNKGTGTVPKMMYRNNGTNDQINPPEFQNHHLSNNLDLGWQRQNFPNSSRNLVRTAYELNPYSMDAALMEDRRQNDLAHINMPGRTNGTLSTSSSSVSNSGLDSVGTIPKCDNVKKYPDKKQIEDQLNQIREYLRVTTSLMSSIKNEDQHAVKDREQFEKMIKDLKSSEAKLEALANDPLYDNSSDLPLIECNKELVENGVDNLSECNAAGYQRNGLQHKVDFTNRKVQLLQEQQNALMNLKRKAENQLSEVRHLAEENQILNQQGTSSNQLRKTKSEQSRIYSDSSQGNRKNYNANSFDPAIKDLEDRIAEMKKDSLRHLSINSQENGVDQAYIQDRLESNNELLNMLENRDGQLTSEHLDLQQKLNELQMEKTQIDQLAQQLQNLGDEEDEDIGNQVRKIVTMKQHLSSLKDLLEVVKNTELSLLNSQNVNELEHDLQDNHHSISIKKDNIRQNVRMNHNQNAGCNSARVNEQWLNEKDSNKALIGIQEREKVLAELKAKKRELEEIMYKQKDRASINNDVCSEISVNKSESSTNNNMFDGSVMSWLPVHPHHNNQIVSAYSSDDCPEEDANEYSDLNSAISVTLGNIAHSQLPGPGHNTTANMSKPRTQVNARVQQGNLPTQFIQHSSPLTSDHRAASMSTTASGFENERSNSLNGVEQNKVQVQKQLELIQQVCQSLIDQQPAANIQQLRNNLTPSPLYTEPRVTMPTNQQVSALNYINPPVEMPYINAQQVNPQFFALNDVANNQNMLAANTLQTQAFLLNTLNQCCQMLWFQQREIASLRNMVTSIQDQMVNRHIDQEISEIPLVNPYIYPPHPTMYRSPSQPRNTTPKTNQVSSACSMPNLNPSSPHANTDGAFSSHNNIRSSPSARLLDSSLNNLNNQNLIGEHHANNTVLPSVNVANMNHSLPTQIWNGQALNNQVAPGNRANNYWDNFRSYSRQNLLSTSSKSNEGLQNPAASERLNTVYDRSHSFSLPPNTPPKLNTVHNESINASGETTPRRHLHLKSSQNSSTCNKSVPAIPPDVLNINHNLPQQKLGDNIEPANDALLDLSNTTADTQGVKEHLTDRVRNRNEWHDNEQSVNFPKSKLFEELRGNVYKEVANLISANENRPHFLIQLFRDLQHVNSDSMRGRTLQSIQTVLTHSLVSPETKRGANRQIPCTSAQANTEPEITQPDTETFSNESLLWSVATSSSKENANVSIENEDPNIGNILKPIVTFLNSHKDEIFYQDLIEAFRGLLVKSIPFAEIFTSRNIQEETFLKHFSIIFNESLEKYKGKRIAEIYKDILKTVTDILVGELSFIYLIQENIPENNGELPSSNSNLPVHENMRLHLQHHSNQTDDGHTPQMQNGDLAEADQSRIELDEEENAEEEGAVGGMLNGVVDVLSNNTTNEQIGPDITDLPKIDFTMISEPEVVFMEQGLDQVPTRLSTRSRSHSNTPSRDRSNSRTNTLEQF